MSKLRGVFETVYHTIIDEGVETDEFIDELDILLDALLEDDYFGTEGQLDPRGDHRNE